MKITNEMLAQYLSNKQLIKELTDINETIAIGIRAAGGAQTDDYIAVVDDKERRNVASIRVFEEKLGHGWLEKHDLINVAKFKQVTVVQKVMDKLLNRASGGAK